MIFFQYLILNAYLIHNVTPTLRQLALFPLSAVSFSLALISGAVFHLKQSSLSGLHDGVSC